MLAKEYPLFQEVKEHLLRQNKRSTLKEKDIEEDSNYGNNIICAYRGDDGSSCAAGCLIPDEEYDASMENCSCNEIRFFTDNYNSSELELLRTLQYLHDNVAVEKWSRALDMVGKETVYSDMRDLQEEICGQDWK